MILKIWIDELTAYCNWHLQLIKSDQTWNSSGLDRSDNFYISYDTLIESNLKISEGFTQALINDLFLQIPIKIWLCVLQIFVWNKQAVYNSNLSEKPISKKCRVESCEVDSQGVIVD